MATYNGELWVGEQISSLVNQVGVEVSLLVSDDCSTDRTLEIVRSFERALPISILPNESRFGAAAKNFFSLMSRANLDGFDYVAFCDQDDIWNSGKLERAVDVLESGRYEGYSAGVEAFWADGRTRTLRQNPKARLYDFLYEGAGQGCTFVVSKSLMDEFREHIDLSASVISNVHYHDWLLYSFCRVKGKAWCIDDYVSMRYRQHSSNDTGAKLSLAGVKRRFSLIRDGWYARQVDSIFLFVEQVSGGARGDVSTLRELRESAQESLLAKTRYCILLMNRGRRSLLDRLFLVLLLLSGAKV